MLAHAEKTIRLRMLELKTLAGLSIIAITSKQFIQVINAEYYLAIAIPVLTPATKRDNNDEHYLILNCPV
uniref:Pyridoxamine 5'-phosphate oxidase family protein n=1 Tax=Heterorhabditis bacteriophora TaxID=37862 RepID=A0A1I7X449_HETBA